MSLYYRLVPKKKMVSRVLILDLDDTIATPERKADGEYLVQPDGSINAKLMDAEMLKMIIEYAELKGIPIHIVTARANIPGNLKVITDLIKSVDGLNENPETSGGFKKAHIHFTGVMIDGEWVYGRPKVDVIKEDIHQKLYPHLPKEALLFVEDMLKYLAPVSDAGFSTCLADPGTKKHFEIIKKFLLHGHQLGTFLTMLKRAYQPVLFNTSAAGAALPSTEKPQILAAPAPG